MKIKILSRLIQIFALYLLVTAVFEIIGKINVIRSGAKTNGKIVSSYKEFDYSTQTSGKRYGTSHYILRPIIQYKINGESYEINGRIFGEIGENYQIGQSVPLIYLPNNPDYAIIDSFLELWSDPSKKILFSIFLFIFGSYLSHIIHYVKNKIISLINPNQFLN
ncbi:DUF3592 domain-containing protein [Leptospira terpstrae]|uniref:DUF3592 domain-containing protein n=1 Tax=Leptospira terpstrae TaxID=293075 RepID=UPI003D032C04